jgi:hypothetical protein
VPHDLLGTPRVTPDARAKSHRARRNLGDQFVDGGRASVCSRYGESVLSCRISVVSSPVRCSPPSATQLCGVNNLTGPGRTPETHTPE